MNAAKESEPGDIELLLPWHAAGTLSQRDKQRVEAALADDPELARRYALVREEFGETIHLNETLGAPSARAMDALFAKLDAEPSRAPAASIKLSARVREFFGTLSPQTLAWSASAAALAIVLQAGLIAGIVFYQQGEPSPGHYQTASMPMANRIEGAYALIRFQPQASAADISKFMEANKLSIADGPTPGGLYRVRVSQGKVSGADLSAIVKTLQDNNASVVGFIAPTQ
jgi:hypothetical protein